MKKILIAIICVLIVVTIGISMYINKIETPKVEQPNPIISTEGITTVLTLEDEISEDAMWCGTFQLIWNDLKNELAKQDIVFNPQLDVVKNLNKETFKEENLSKKSYYKKYGTPTQKLKNEIEQAIKDKFGETSKILDDFNWEGKNPGDYFLYAMLKKEFKFEKEFDEIKEISFNDSKVDGFGITDNSENYEILKNQIEVLYYNSKEDFAIKLKTKQEDEVVLCKNPDGKTFNEIYKDILEKNKNYKGNKEVLEGEKLQIPTIKINEKSEFTEIENKTFEFANGDIYEIETALQAIEFELDKSGGKIISEAGMMATESISISPIEPREFIFDDTFAIFLIESEKGAPYFAAKINDIKKFQ